MSRRARAFAQRDRVRAQDARGEAPFVLDVRSAREPRSSRCPSSTYCSRTARHPHCRPAPNHRDILVSCKVGGRSAVACQSLAAAGVHQPRRRRIVGQAD